MLRFPPVSAKAACQGFAHGGLGPRPGGKRGAGDGGDHQRRRCGGDGGKEAENKEGKARQGE